MRDTAARFAEYAGLVAAAIGDGVGLWITINEPWCSAWLGYGSGRHAPGRRRVGEAVAAAHHLLLAHGLGLQAVRAAVGAADVGVTCNLAPVRAATQHPDDVAAARRVDGNLNRMFIDPLLKGRYPDDVVAHHSEAEPGFSVVEDGDLEVIAGPIDFLGVNFYSPQVVAARDRVEETRAAGYGVEPPDDDVVAADLGSIAVQRPGVERTAMNWEIDPGSYTDLLVGLRAGYGRLPIYLTENGCAFADYIGPDGGVHDARRIAYLDGHLEAVRNAIAHDVDVRGYFVWSLLDNFEWNLGYSKRFGITWVDYPSGARLPKDSFAWYRRVVEANALPPR